MVGRGAFLDGRLFLGGTDGSNPSPSSTESATNLDLGGRGGAAASSRGIGCPGSHALVLTAPRDLERTDRERIGRRHVPVTTEPNELCAELHNRMPVILAPEVRPVWLGEEPADEAQLKSFLVPYPSEEMVC